MVMLDDLSDVPRHTIKAEEQSNPVVFEGIFVMDLLVPDEKHQTRWVRQGTAMRVKQAP